MTGLPRAYGPSGRDPGEDAMGSLQCTDCAVWRKGVSAVAALILAIALPTAASGAATAAPLPPTLLGGEIRAGDCHTEPADTCELAIKSKAALGLIAFNTPYLFGEKALHDRLTCSSCHGTSRISGPAERLVFDQPVPDLHRAEWRPPIGRHARSPDLEHFVLHAIRDEFSGGTPSDDIVAALADYVRQLPAPAGAGTRSTGSTIGPLGIVQLAVLLMAQRDQQAIPDRVGFLVASARNALGEIAAGAPGDIAVSRVELDEMNGELKLIDALAPGPFAADGEALARSLIRKLGRMRAAAGLPDIVLDAD
eukprot:gene22496-23677_t